MKIRNRLTLLFTILFAAVLLGVVLAIYLSYAQNRKEEYFKRLKQQAVSKANMLFDSKIAPGVLQMIYKNSPNSLFQEEVAIYDTSFHLLYHDAVEIDKVKETRAMIDEIIAKKEIDFFQGKLQVVGFLYPHNNKYYVITAAAIDDYGFAKLLNLKYTLITTYLISIVVVLFAGLFFSRQALKPVSDLVDKVEEITATNLDLRVNEGNGRDEIAELAKTFNEMLNRLEKSFDAQKEFVSNISHELRTPLTAMLAELQVAVGNERTNDEYKESIHHAISDAQKLVRLSNSLLDLAKASYDKTEIAFKEIRLDEVLLDARNDVMHDLPDSNVNIVFENEIENDNVISVKGNEYLLKVAFMNLLENGCKFSKEREAIVSIAYFNNKSILRFRDNGIGIAEEDLPNIFAPFYRGNNNCFVGGNGIGLSLIEKIINLHKGEISVVSKVDEGTTFTVELPHL